MTESAEASSALTAGLWSVALYYRYNVCWSVKRVRAESGSHREVESIKAPHFLPRWHHEDLRHRSDASLSSNNDSFTLFFVCLLKPTAEECLLLPCKELPSSLPIAA